MRRSFDLLARPYRWLEYATFGRALQRCRVWFLLDYPGVQDALVLGDGDGRFTAALTAAAPQARVLAVDSSAGMLAALRTRCEAQGDVHRLTTCQADLQHGLPLLVRARRYDLVASHFSLDCLSEADIARLACELAPLLRAGGSWVISDFHVPRSWLRLPARLLIRALYVAFRLLTGLRTQRLPDYTAVLQQCGYAQQRHRLLLGGLLTTEVWRLASHGATAPGRMGRDEPVRDAAWVCGNAP